MGYSLYIERESEDISSEEWVEAVNFIEGAKTDDSELTRFFNLMQSP